jgi:hypothetical protein
VDKYIAVRFSDSTVFQSIQLFDVIGNLLYCNSLNGITEINIDIQHHAKGIYIVTATGYNTMESKKIMIK